MIGGSRDQQRWRHYTEHLEGFIGGFYRSADAGKYSYIQLWNPANSGVKLLCHKIIISRGTGNPFYLLHYNAALTSDGYEGNKLLGGAAPLGQVKYTTTDTTVGTMIAMGNPQGYSESFIDFTPIIVPEGLGLLLRGYALNTPMCAMFEWIERPA